MIGLGISTSLGFGSALDDSVTFHPSQVAGCRAFWDITSPSHLVYGTTFKASGTSPPVVTLTRQPVIAAAIRIECTSSTQFRWSNDGGVSWAESLVTIPNGSTYDAGSSGEFTFASGTYGATNIYEATLAQWKSMVSATDVWSQATPTKQARLVTGPNNTIALRSDGVDDLYSVGTIALGSPGSGNKTFYWGVVRFDAYSSNDQLIGSDNARVAISFNATTNTLQQLCGSVANPTAVSISSFGGISALFNGSTSDFLRWKSTTTTGSNAGGTAPLNNNLYLFNRNDVATTMMQASLVCFGIYNNNPTTSLSDMEAWSVGKFGSGLWT